MKRIRTNIAVLSLSLMLLTGCSQQTAADLIAIVGTAAASIAVIQGNVELSQKLTGDTQKAAQQIAAWKTGTPSQDIIQTLGIVEADLNLLPVSNKTAALIQLALITTQEIIVLFPQTGIAHANIAAVAPQVKDAKDFKRQWNALLVAHPELKAAKL